MTTEEAINTWLPIIKMGVETMPECKDAIEMAIKALEQEFVGSTQKHVENTLEMRCEDAISRQAALKLFATNDGHYLYEAIRDLPSVTPTVTEFADRCRECGKQRTGHWEMCEDADGIYGVCDICGTDADFSHYGKAYPYCPNCGAKMESEEQA